MTKSQNLFYRALRAAGRPAAAALALSRCLELLRQLATGDDPVILLVSLAEASQKRPDERS